MAQRRGEARQQLDPQHAVGLANGRESLLEERYESLVGAGVHPQEPSAVANRRPGEQFGQPLRPGDLCRAQEGGLRRLTVPGPPPRIGKGQEQLAAEPCAGGVHPERLDRHPVQAYRFLVGELRDRVIAGAAGVLEGLVARPAGAATK